jgi:hypothetical protein
MLMIELIGPKAIMIMSLFCFIDPVAICRFSSFLS